MNLLENAVKYSPIGGTIRIMLNYSKQSADGSESVELKIEDEGPGIPEDSRTKVFERFYRVDDARSREAGGAGLGLAIAKWAVNANDGEIALEPRATGGCTFAITLPCANGASQKNGFEARQSGV